MLLQSNGCNEGQKGAAPSSAKDQHYPPLHRFVNVPSPGSPSGIALDTVTGQYCKTWEWNYKATAMNGGLDTLPTCLSIFNDFPAGESSKNDPVGLSQSDSPSQ